MALANVAFLAATNGLRVLIMDWDLEAPGVHYYFRGMTDAPEAKALREAPGVLDLTWEWVTSVRTESDSGVSATVERLLSGQAFNECVRPLIDPELFGDEDACLDILRAGRDTIVQPEPRSYEDALAEFSWAHFFAKDAGGIMLSALRDWSRANYDIVLIDSRTGLADVAGICTMQLPDEVALCFVLNRQNIEGVARIAAAIRAKRSETIRLHIVPMRTARENTPEEADARARARREFTMVGGFPGDTFDQQFKSLSVSAAANVPFYESIAAVVADDPNTDPLALNYLRLASDLVGRDLKMPDLYDWWVERVRRRLQPKHATADYLVKLSSTSPDRALEEVAHLIDAALDTVLDHEGELDDAYLDALVAAAFAVSDSTERFFECAQMLQQTLDLVRTLAARHPGAWRVRLIEALQHLLDTAGDLDTEEEIALLDELDAQLVDDPLIVSRLERLRRRRRAARLYVVDYNAEAAFQAIADISRIAEELHEISLSAEQQMSVQLAEADIHLLRGDIYLFEENQLRALVEFRRGAKVVDSIDSDERRQELARMRFDLSFRLATRLPDIVELEERAERALIAVRNVGQTQSAFVFFTDLIEPVLSIKSSDVLNTFIELLFVPERSTAFAGYSSRQPRTAMNFFTTVARIIEQLTDLSDERSFENLERVIRQTILVTRSLHRRRLTMALSTSAEAGLLHSILILKEALKGHHDYDVVIEELHEIENFILHRRGNRN